MYDIDKLNMDTERETVARAICTACGEVPDHIGDAQGNAFRWQDYLEIADAAIAAMGTVYARGSELAERKAASIDTPEFRELFRPLLDAFEVWDESTPVSEEACQAYASLVAYIDERK